MNLEFNSTEKHPSAERMENSTRRTRSSNWEHAHTKALAELKREATNNEECGAVVWLGIAQTLSTRFPGQIKTGDQCRGRWDTLVKVYSRIEPYCVETGRNHWELDEDELKSLKLASEYDRDWYDIVEQMCSPRRREERCDRDLMLAKRGKVSHSVELPEHPPNRDTTCPASTSKSVNYYEPSTLESTTTYAQVPSRPSLEVDKLSPEEEIPRLKNGDDGLVLEATQHGQVSHEVSEDPQTLESTKLLRHTFPAENGAELKEDDLWAYANANPIETLDEIEQPDTAYAQVSSSPSLEIDKLSPEEEVPRLKNGNDGLVLEATQLWQHGQVSHEVSQEPQTMESANLLPHTFLAENGAELKEPLQDDLWALLGFPPLETLAEIEQSGTESELTDPSLWSWKPVLHRDANWKMKSAPLPSMRREQRRRQENQSRQEHRLHSTAWRESNPSRVEFVIQPALLPSTTMTSSTPSRSSDSAISRQSRRRPLQVIVFNVLQFCHACDRKESAEDMEMESKRAARLKVKVQKEALSSRKENVPAMFNAASATSATSATRGDKPLQKDTRRISKPAASDKKEEESMSRKAERQQLGGKSSGSKCLPIGQLCAKLSRKLFPAFRQSSH